MAVLELHGELQHLIRMKAHLEEEHPTTRGNMILRNDVNPNPVKKRTFMTNLKGTLKGMGTSTGNILEKLAKSDRELNEKIKKITKSAY